MGLKEELQDLDRRVASIVSEEEDPVDLFMDAVRDKYGDSITIMDMNERGLKEHSNFLLQQFTGPDDGRVTFDYYYRDLDNLLFIRKVDLSQSVPGSFGIIRRRNNG